MGCLKLNIEEGSQLRLVYSKKGQRLLKIRGSYYPFGLKQKGYNYNVTGNGNSLGQKFKTFQGQEVDEELNLNWHNFKFRTYDRSIGRFLQIDPLAPTYVYNSTYAFAENNVVSGIDLEGKELSFELDGNRATAVSGPRLQV